MVMMLVWCGEVLWLAGWLCLANGRNRKAKQTNKPNKTFPLRAFRMKSIEMTPEKTRWDVVAEKESQKNVKTRKASTKHIIPYEFMNTIIVINCQHENILK